MDILIVECLWDFLLLWGICCFWFLVMLDLVFYLFIVSACNIFFMSPKSKMADPCGLEFISIVVEHLLKVLD